jgi:signal transduction histidine kinase/PAS domain-containing protein
MTDQNQMVSPGELERGDLVYQQLLEAAGERLLIFDEQSIIHYVSPAAAEFLTVTADVLRGSSVSAWVSGTALSQIFALRGTVKPRRIHTILRLQHGHVVVRLICHAQQAASGYQFHCLIQPNVSQQPALEPSGTHALYQLLARNLPDTVVILFDRSLRVQVVQGSALQHFYPGYRTLQGKNLQDVLIESIPEAARLLQECQNSLIGQESFLEQRFNNMHFSIHVMPVRTPPTGISGGLIVAQNIHARRESEQALRSSEKRNRALLDALPDTMMVVQRSGIITEIHTGADKRSCFPNQIVPGTSLSEIGMPADVVADAMLYIRVALTSQQIQSFAFSLPSEYGREEDSPVYYEARVFALSNDEVLLLLRDMSAFKRIQDELQRHVEDLTIVRQVNSELSDKLNLTYVAQLALDAALRLSKADAGFLALQQQDEPLHLVHVIGAYDLRQVRQMLQDNQGLIAQVVRTQKPELLPDVAARKDYTPTLKDTCSVMVIPLVSNERLIGIVYLETRIAHRFRPERFQLLQLVTSPIAAYLDNARLYYQTQEQLQQLQKLYAEVAQLEQLKTDMIRIASHDLKNPLSAIIGYLDLLNVDMSNLKPQQQSYLEHVQTAAYRMQRLTSSILSLERIEHMAQEHSREQIDLIELLNRCIKQQMDQIVERNQVMRRQFPDQPVMVTGDVIQLHEAITNLLVNASKYTPRDGTITVILQHDEGSAQVRICDTGYGIPAELQSRLFTPFFRVLTQETRSIEGTGLGLHLVRNIIERHQGKLFFESTYGKGSIFGFDLPLYLPSADDVLPDSLLSDS